MTVIGNPMGARVADRMDRAGTGAVCSRCAAGVLVSAHPGAERVVCTGCVAALTPRSTWAGHVATGTWWLEELLEHERSGSTDVLLCHGNQLARYRRDGCDLVLVDTVSPAESTDSLPMPTT